VPETTSNPQYDVEWHYRDMEDDILKDRIHKRLYARMDIGMVEEVERLHSEGVSWERLESLGLEYRYLEMAIWHYAKRQRTWFKKYIK
jgi:tRNA dimethylallyltransferase